MIVNGNNCGTLVKLTTENDFYTNFQKLMAVNENSAVMIRYMKDNFGFDMEKRLKFSSIRSLEVSANASMNFLKFWVEFKLWKRRDIENFFEEEPSNHYALLIFNIVRNRNSCLDKNWKSYSESFGTRYSNVDMIAIMSSEISLLLQLAYEIKNYEAISYFLKNHSSVKINYFRLRSRGNQSFAFYMAENGDCALLKMCLNVSQFNWVLLKSNENMTYDIDQTIFERCLCGYNRAKRCVS